MNRSRVALALCSLASASACDVAPAAPRDAPRLVATSAVLGDRGFAELTAGEPIALWFDRPLWPRSINRATITVQSGGVSLTPRLRYEPVQHAVRVLIDAGEVREDLEYELSVRGGITAWDGAIAAGQATVRLRFVRRAPVASRSVSFRGEVAPLLQERCSSAMCHGGAEPAMGVDLSTPEAIVRTTIAAPSRLWSSSAPGGEFYWAGMTLIERGSPGESFLLYKLLGDGPMRGAQMPRGAAPLSASELQRISDWIAEGAVDDR
ncbi:MAG: hypothetical protein U0269_02560 [Polyangiales bacterium]